MQTPYRLAQTLGMPVVSDVVKLTVDGRNAVIEREIEGGGREVVEVGLPCVIGATRGLNEPHYPKLPEILQAKKKEIKLIPIAELGLSPARAVRRSSSWRPPPKEARPGSWKGPPAKRSSSSSAC